MSLLDDPPHTVTVIPKITKPDGYGGHKYVDGDPVDIRCAVQPVSSEEKQGLDGTQADVTDRVILRSGWPGGPHSTVKWSGREFDQLGTPRVYRMSSHTAHQDVMLKELYTEAK